MISRRSFIAVLLASVAAPGFAKTELVVAETAFEPEMVRDIARELSRRDYQLRPTIPQAWQDLSYDDMGHIWFDPRNGIWIDENRPMKMDLFTAGLYVTRPVQVNLVEDGVAKTLGYDLSLFATTDEFPELPIDDTMGYGGFRLRAALEEPDLFNEFFVFNGASYFRGIGNGQNYGLSARGLALRTGEPGGEEFPDFTRFWIEAAEPDDTVFTVHALLDSPSTTGAYTFKISHGAPGEATQVDVDAVLFPRVELTHVGFGALTSMFLFDETNRSRFDDFRPAVYDSEGLLIWNGNGEQLWRPLANPVQLQRSSFLDTSPRGFGLIQRDRNPDDFADLEAHYENRPSLWITPRGDWGPGTVELVEIPADKEIYDNIVAYWRPGQPMIVGTEYEFRYSMAWGGDPQGLPELSRVTNTRIGKGFDQVRTVIAIDFMDHPDFSEDLSEVELRVFSEAGDMSEPVLQRNAGTGGVRLAFSFLPEGDEAIEFRAQMFIDDQPVSEVWLYRWTS